MAPPNSSIDNRKKFGMIEFLNENFIMVNDKIVDMYSLNVNVDSVLIVSVDYSKVTYDKRESLQEDVEAYMKAKFPNNQILVISKNDSIHLHKV